MIVKLFPEFIKDIDNKNQFFPEIVRSIRWKNQSRSSNGSNSFPPDSFAF